MVIVLNPEKVGKFIKKLRKDNNLTQQKLADKYGVTYQAVSKWENGINLPDVTLIRQMSKDFNISIEDILDGNLITKKKNRNKNILIGSILLIAIIALIIGTIIIVKNIMIIRLLNLKLYQQHAMNLMYQEVLLMIRKSLLSIFHI